MVEFICILLHQEVDLLTSLDQYIFKNLLSLYFMLLFLSSLFFSFIIMVPLTLLNNLCLFLFEKINPNTISIGNKKDFPNDSIAMYIIFALSQ